MGQSSLFAGRPGCRQSRGKEKRFAPATNAKTKRKLRGTTLLARQYRATLARNVRHPPEKPVSLPGERHAAVPPRLHLPRGSLNGQAGCVPVHCEYGNYIIFPVRCKGELRGKYTHLHKRKRRAPHLQPLPLRTLAYASPKLLLSTPHMAHSKSSGRSSHFVPGAIPPSG